MKNPVTAWHDEPPDPIPLEELLAMQRLHRRGQVPCPATHRTPSEGRCACDTILKNIDPPAELVETAAPRTPGVSDISRPMQMNSLFSSHPHIGKLASAR